MTPTTAAILAGGSGTRLRSVVSDRPKPLAVVGGRPFLAYLLDQLADAGLQRVVLMTGYRGEQIQQELGETYRGLRLYYSQETVPLGTAGALRLAFDRLFPDKPAAGGRGSGNVLVLNGDSYCSFDLAAFSASHQRRSAAASLVLTHVADTSRFGRVEVAEQERIERFCEKKPLSGAGWINAGIYLMPRQLVAEIPAGRAVSIEKEMFPIWLQRGGLFGHLTDGHFLDIGTPEAYSNAELFLSEIISNCTFYGNLPEQEWQENTTRGSNQSASGIGLSRAGRIKDDQQQDALSDLFFWRRH